MFLIGGLAYGQLDSVKISTPDTGLGDPLRTAFKKVNLGIIQINTNTTAIGLRLLKTDTAAMLTPYVNHNDTATMLTPYINRADTASMLTNYTKGTDVALKVSISDTASMLTPYINRADTSSMLTKYATDANVALKVNIADTASMLTNYINKADTAAMLTNYINRADTATMLIPYVNHNDTASMLTPYILTTEIDLAASDTANMLISYINRADTAAMLTKYPHKLNPDISGTITMDNGATIINTDADNLDITEDNVNFSNDVDIGGNATFGNSTTGSSLYVKQLKDTTYVTDNYTLVLGDAGNWIDMLVAAEKSLTIPPHTDVAIPVGTEIYIMQAGAGIIGVTAGVGVTLAFPLDSTHLNTQYRSAFIRQWAEDKWVAGGLQD